jgi:hypothetical protein
MSTPTDFQALFANIHPPANRSASANVEQSNTQSVMYNASAQQQPASTSPIGAQSHSSFPMNSSFTSQEKDDRTSNLLNLLKFSQPNPNSSSSSTATHNNPASLRSTSFHTVPDTTSVEAQSVHGRGISASDLVASFMSKPHPPPTAQTAMSPPSGSSGDSRKASSSAQDDPQDILLRLLNRGGQKDTTKSDTQAQENKPPVQRVPEAFADDLKQDAADAAAQNVSPAPNRSNGGSPAPRIFGSERQSSSFEPSVAIDRDRAPSKPVFTYVNPFDQLAASSPRNRTPKPDPASGRNSPAVELLKKQAEGSKRKSQESSPEPSLRRKLTPVSIKNRRSPPPAQYQPKTESVSNALKEVASQVGNEAEGALARAEQGESDMPIKQEETSPDNSIDELADKLQDAAIDADKLQEAAIEIKKELDKEENQGALEDIKSAAAAESIREVIEETASGELLENSWESADGEESPTKEDEDSGNRVVKVYSFPIKPFVTITIKQLPDAEVQFRDDSILDIARLKKTFDQTDRSLTSATSEYIVYAQVKAGGIRVIRQEDGADKSLFKSSNDRVFNVALPTTPYKSLSTYSQAVLATGVSGTVYWAPIFRTENDLFEANTIENESLAFPPSGVGEDPSSTSGGQLKTRARKSARHPDYFAIGRGKSIHIVFTLPAAMPKYRKAPGAVDTDQFFKDRALKINTGKAGKDFTFSEDDTVIVSLDKNGMIKFWDIRDLVEGQNPTANKVTAVEVKEPIMTLASAATSKEKPWPTSVMLLDKARPYARGIALRYMIVGLKQNHTLQLWDLVLGKPVQELNFPHTSDADAICSFGYDPNSGMLVVGHPTRNSIFFIHLSAPRYGLKPMCQADLLQRVVGKEMPAPESTAFLSGIREVSFSLKGQLRSLELLPVVNKPKAGSNVGTEANRDETVLFELYVMHSRGVTCLRIQKEDLGWGENNESLHEVKALEAGVIELAELRTELADSVSGTETPTPARVADRDKKKQGEDIVRAAPPPELQESTPNGQAKQLDLNHDTVQASSSTDKSERKKKGRNKSKGSAPKPEDNSDVQSQLQSSSHLLSATPDPSSSTTDPTAFSTLADDFKDNNDNKAPEPSESMDPTKPVFYSTTPTKSGRSDTINLGISGDFLDKEIKKIERGVSAEVTKILNRSLDSLHRRLLEDKHADQIKEGARTETVLRLVSEALNQNVEKSLSRIVNEQLTHVAVPALQTVTKQVIEKHVTKVMERRVADAVSQSLGAWMNREMHQHFPAAVTQAFHNTGTLPDIIATKVATQVNTQVAGHLERFITNQVTNNIIAESNKQAAKIADLNAKMMEQTAKIDQLTSLLRGSIDTISTMAAAQSDFQTEILKLQRQLGTGTGSSGPTENQLTSYTVSREGTESPTVRSPVPTKTAEEIELAEITELMTEGQFTEGSIKASIFRVSCFHY